MAILAPLLLILGLIGLILPILPGIPLLILAAVLFTANSPGLRRRLFSSPRLAAYLHRFEAVFATPGPDGLTAWQRTKLKALTVLSGLFPKSPKSRR